MAKNYKLPYIPDKNLYFAVTGACSYVRATGWFHKACSYYADKYDVDVDEVEKYVRIAQGNGQKIANAKKKRTYHWYALEFSVMDGYDPYFSEYDAQYAVKHATSAENAEKAVRKRYFCYGDGSERSFRDAYFGKVEEFSSEKDAKECAKRWVKENENFVNGSRNEEGIKALEEFASRFSSEIGGN